VLRGVLSKLRCAVWLRVSGALFSAALFRAVTATLFVDSEVESKPPACFIAGIHLDYLFIAQTPKEFPGELA
jgi:hypothetical protein